ncbi:uncharacterized protein ACA1_335990 [Acanthamoeba castellanii str. Neff]|uniref:SET domain containing protein n=1 Tax=Acanthamoeba castellanii (strain ATCC 30010 / Neff) TaxID=1257118 RepID=L8H3Z0_ACACF|nr:uncharacterized protein ACA1_335990 [Acanthamoeba castellanii str. Neff]ELR19136.1 hypothetical protein ACA1_335990 [Acanthamoeba castellanii str. Neff]
MSFITKRWRQFVANRVGQHVESGSFQENLDTFKACFLTSYHRHKRHIPVTPENKALLEDTSELDAEMTRMSYLKQKTVVRKDVHGQVLDLFKFVHELGGMDPYPQPLNPAKEESFEAELDQVTRHTEQGVHVKGHILPGTVHFPYTLNENAIKGNNYMYGRYDGVVVDGRDWERKAFAARRLQTRLERVGQSIKDEKTLLRFRNPFGIAQYINHPPGGKQPNVMCVGYEFPNTFPDELKPYIPHEHVKEPNIFFNTMTDCYIRSIMCIATRHITDEELFLNYRYNPINPYPDWYVQPDVAEAERRWKKPKALANPFW